MQMTTFKEFLSEAAVNGDTPKYTALDVSTAIETVNKYAKNALWMLQKNRPLYRGDNQINQVEQHGFALVDTTTTQRKSQNTSNYYTVILDNNPNMTDFPKRSRSFIATNDKSTAHDYADDEPYVLIPFDDAKIGSVNEYDIWSTRITLFGIESDIEDHNISFEHAGIKQTIEDIREFDRRLKAGDKKAFKAFLSCFGGGETDHEGHIAEMTAHAKVFLESIWEAYSPKSTGHTLETNSSVQRLKPKTEVWVGGKVLLISTDMWQALRRGIKK